MRTWFFSAKQVIWCLLTCLAVGNYLGTGSELPLPVLREATLPAISGLTIVIDPGHGGDDPGAVSVKGDLEKDITLAIAEELEYLLRKAAVFAVVVRRGDYDLADSSETNLLKRKMQDLDRRVALAKEAQADLFISIHANFFPSPIWYGAQTFYYPGRPEDERLAKAIQAELVRHLGPNKRQALPGDFRVLREAGMPAVLIEVGFLSNPKEAALLSERGYQKRVAAAIFDGILRYYSAANSL